MDEAGEELRESMDGVATLLDLRVLDLVRMGDV